MPTVIDTVAWLRVENGRILGTRSRNKDVYYIPGGKRESGESDLQTLLREVEEELTVAILPETAAHFGTYEAQAHGHPDGVTVRMSCYTGDYRGTLTPSNEIADIAWLSHADRNSTPPVDRLLLDNLRARGELS